MTTATYDCDSKGHVCITHDTGHVDTYYLSTAVETLAAREAMWALGIESLPVYHGEGTDEVKGSRVLFARD